MTPRLRRRLGIAAALAALPLVLVLLREMLVDHPPASLTGVITAGARARQIFGEGQKRGNLKHAFTLVGDSISADARFLQPIGQGQYDLGDYGRLEETIRYFAGPNGRGEDPFVSRSLAAEVGWMTESVLNPALADAGYCEPEESPLVCEYRRSRPAVALIMLGTNDLAGGRALETYRANLRQIVEISIDQGVIPVLSTIPPLTRSEAENARVADFNRVVHEVARQYGIPLVDYWQALQDAPDFGISSDGVHPNGPPDGQSATFDSAHLRYGFTIRNLTALDALDQVRRRAME